MKTFIYRLFFTRNDDLDTLQILFNAVTIFTLIIVWRISNTSSDAVQIEGLITLRYLFGALILTAVPKWLVPSIKPTPSTSQSE
jgi:hypothetical protein